MTIGIISDIHSNIYGLKSVLKKLQNTDLILCAGDIVGYYTFVNEVIDEIRKKNIQSILGNHDAYLLETIPIPDNPIKKISIEYTEKIITKKNLDYLKKIATPYKELVIDAIKIKMYHGSPWNYFEGYIYPDHHNFDKFKKIDADIIILGHTHWPMIKRVNKTIIVNPGSCGQPRDYNPQASFALLDTKTKEVAIKRVEYKVDNVCNAVKKADLDTELINILKRTK